MRGPIDDLDLPANLEKIVLSLILLAIFPQQAEGPTVPSQWTQGTSLAQPQYNQPRQKIGPNATTKQNNIVLPVKPAPTDQRLPVELDVTSITSPINLEHLIALVETGSVEITLPNGRAINLTTHKLTQQHGSTVISAMADNLVSTFTLRGSHLLGTLATQHGVFRITDSQAWPHKQLNYRISVPQDFISPFSSNRPGTKGINHAAYSS